MTVVPGPSELVCSGKALTRTSLGTTLSVLILGALAGGSPEERPGADALPSLAATPTRDAAAAPRRPGLPLAVHCKGGQTEDTGDRKQRWDPGSVGKWGQRWGGDINSIQIRQGKSPRSVGAGP